MPKVGYSIRIKQGDLQELREIAKEERRTLANLFDLIFFKYLRNRRQSKHADHK